MNIKVFPLLAALCLLLLSCSDPTPKPHTPAAPEAERTVVIYMMAENSLYDFARRDLAEIRAAAAKIPANTNLIVYVDDQLLPRVYQATASEGLKEWKTWDRDHNSADPRVMLSVMSDIVRHFPAKDYVYDLWSHGSGWAPRTRYIGIDNDKNTGSNTGLSMDIPDLRDVLSQLPHPSLLMFDACAMQSVEVAYELRHLARYILGSPAELHADGAPFHLIMESLMQGRYMDMAHTYFDAYKDGEGAVLSLVDCAKLEALAAATAGVLPRLQRYVMMNDADKVQAYMPWTSTTGWNPEAYDIRSAMHLALSETEYEQWMQALDEAVPFRASTSQWASAYSGWNHRRLTDPDHYAALSMYIPQDKYIPYGWHDKFARLQWYGAAGFQALGWPKLSAEQHTP